ncbi:MAG TPA: hypothetical protein ENI17_13370 [Pseudomonas xinjiangensis]|uniref:Uncharacterized protein n=2 Tax=root TaxID=1 RepID=A0A7V1BNL5_9GAMM|nr:hypothetical protein [Halopseudomonas xinjiangensis]HEC48599.1 hypothetical protein [Halopseudomonas xinjiangensis]
MTKMFSLTSRLFLFFCFLSSLFVNGSMSHAANSSKTSCTVEGSLPWRHVDLSKTAKVEVKPLEGSSEGGDIAIYLMRGEVAAIKTVFLAETGKAEIDYYFGPGGDNGQYLVELSDYRYTAPIYFPDSKIASISINQFVICEGVDPNYPGSQDLSREYERAVQVLSSVRKLLEK